MNAFLTAILSKFSGSAIENDVGGRIYLDRAESPDTPYLVYSIVSAVPDRTFSERYTNILMQFDLYSTRSAGSAVMTTMYADLVALFDECALAPTGYTLVWMKEENLVTMVEDRSPLQDGSQLMNHWSVDFEVRISKN